MKIKITNQEMIDICDQLFSKDVAKTSIKIDVKDFEKINRYLSFEEGKLKKNGTF